ncbi:MAG: hypothetical protein IT327_02990 [Anaerolineae bacterium]|nr:hypothetical protein [Anaerolineae bacterium]
MDPNFVISILVVFGIIVCLLIVAVVAIVFGQNNMAVTMGKAVERIAREAIKRIPI